MENSEFCGYYNWETYQTKLLLDHELSQVFDKNEFKCTDFDDEVAYFGRCMVDYAYYYLQYNQLQDAYMHPFYHLIKHENQINWYEVYACFLQSYDDLNENSIEGEL
ncbi:MAG: hypothetical protein K9L02_02995 [Acholeplasmataceae bacterium]|nr:hypothetical protein [Acholeplasmataceae bacterium]